MATDTEKKHLFAFHKNSKTFEYLPWDYFWWDQPAQSFYFYHDDKEEFRKMTLAHINKIDMSFFHHFLENAFRSFSAITPETHLKYFFCFRYNNCYVYNPETNKYYSTSGSLMTYDTEPSDLQYFQNECLLMNGKPWKEIRRKIIINCRDFSGKTLLDKISEKNELIHSLNLFLK